MKKVAIIGGGLAGTSCAYFLKKAGAEPVVYDGASGLASGASGNRVGLYNPRFSAHFDENAKFYSRAFFDVIDLFAIAGDEVDYNPCGTLYLIMNERRERQFAQTLDNWGWPSSDMRLLNPEQASEVAGVRIDCSALYLPRAGSACPAKLCDFYARGIETKFGAAVQDLSELGADAIVLAGGVGVLDFDVASHLPLKPVRGQVSYINSTPKLSELNCALCYSGYIAPNLGGRHVVGSSFQPWLSHSEIIDGDDAENLEKLFGAVPDLKGDYEVVDNRAAVRTASKDHFPVAGILSDNDIPIYVSTAHGSHGVLSSLLCAKIISSMILGGDMPVGGDVLKALSPDRFIR